MMQVSSATGDAKKHLVQNYDCFIFDCDGTLWRGNEVIPGVPEVLEKLRSRNKKVLFVTNNSTKSRAAYAQKFKELGIAVNFEEIYGSAYAGASYLKSIGFDSKAYVVGAEGIVQELNAAGIETIGGPDDVGKQVDWKKGVEHDPKVGAVVVGVDHNISYYKISYASLCILQNPNCLFIATNTDARGHFLPNQELPGAGSCVAAIKAVVEREPVVVGKPAGFLLDEIMRVHNLTRKQICMVGDRLDTDVLWGVEHGFSTCLVYTGVTTPEVLVSPTNHIRPTYVLESLSDLLTVL